MGVNGIPNNAKLDYNGKRRPTRSPFPCSTLKTKRLAKGVKQMLRKKIKKFFRNLFRLKPSAEEIKIQKIKSAYAVHRFVSSLSRREIECRAENPGLYAQEDREAWYALLEETKTIEEIRDGRFVLIDNFINRGQVLGDATLIFTMLLAFRHCQDKLIRLFFTSAMEVAIMDGDADTITSIRKTMQAFERNRGSEIVEKWLHGYRYIIENY
jgi:hypothetical protein